MTRSAGASNPVRDTYPHAYRDHMASPAHVTTTDATIDGLAFRTRSSRGGASGAAPYVLVHGVGTSHRYLRRLHALLATHADVHSIDLPGFGGLPAPAGSPGVAQIAEALATVVDALGVTSAVLVGHSMGAQWVVDLAVQRPDLARAVVLCSPVTDSARRSMFTQTLLLGLDSAHEPPKVGAIVLGDYARCGPVWYFAQVRHMLRYPLEDRVAALTAPVLVIRGGKDRIANLRWCTALRDRAASGTLAVVPGHRHLVQHTAAADVAAHIRAFVASATDAATA